MPDQTATPREHAWGWAALVGIGAVYILAICVLLVLMWDLRRNISVVTERLPSAMLAFERSIGYGGLIHNFKNHILRMNEGSYGSAALADYLAAMQALDEVERIADESGLKIEFGEIRATLDRYRDMIGKIDEAHRLGLPARATDDSVRVTDVEALEDLRVANDEIAGALARDIAKRKVQILSMIGVISLLMLLLPAGALTMLRLKRRAERGYVTRIEALNAGLDRRNEELAASNHALSVTNAELNEFAHAAAHDLRTPLRGISHEAEYLVQEFGDRMEQEVNERLVHIQALCGRLDMVMTLLLRYARLAPPTQVDMVDPLGVLEEIEVGIGLRLASAGGQIAVETELPPVRCRRFDLGMVFQKLIDNALTYNRAAEKEIAVGFLSRAEIGDEVFRDAFYVRDNGIGISPEYHDDVFRMFRRLHHDDAYGPGAGAGLSFVKKLTGNYGGFVRLVSEPDAGTTVYFSFGRQAGNREEFARERAPEPARLQAVGH